MMDEIPRLSPAMASRKNQVLAFIRLYWRAHGVGPSLSEIAAVCNTNRSRVQDAIRKLAKEGRVIREPGKARGVRPAESHEEALQLLEAQGWAVNPTRLELIHPGAPLLDLDEAGRLTVTNTSLPLSIARAHGAAQSGDERHAGDGDGSGGGRRGGERGQG